MEPLHSSPIIIMIIIIILILIIIIINYISVQAILSYPQLHGMRIQRDTASTGGRE